MGNPLAARPIGCSDPIGSTRVAGSHRSARLAWLAAVLLFSGAVGAAPDPAADTVTSPSPSSLQKRWLFVWRDMSDPREVDRMVARFAQARSAGYNGVAFSHNIPREKAAELRQAAAEHRLDLIAIVMGGTRDRNYVEGVLVQVPS